jgi:hypothetical protein
MMVSTRSIVLVVEIVMVNSVVEAVVERMEVIVTAAVLEAIADIVVVAGVRLGESLAHVDLKNRKGPMWPGW